MQELFLPIEGFESLYLISSFGRVKSIRNNLYLKGDKTRGYLRVTLHNNGQKHRYFVHRLVGMHFLKESYSVNKNVINHLDLNPANNRVDNLEWTDIKGNTIHAMNNSPRWIIPKGIKNGQSKLSEKDIQLIFKLRKKGLTQKAISVILNVSRSCIAHVTQGNRWKHMKGILCRD